MSEEVLLQGNGLVFTAGDSAELAKCFEGISVNRAQYLGAISEGMLDEYSWELQSSKLISAHDELASH